MGREICFRRRFLPGGGWVVNANTWTARIPMCTARIQSDSQPISEGSELEAQPPCLRTPWAPGCGHVRFLCCCVKCEETKTP